MYLVISTPPGAFMYWKFPSSLSIAAAGLDAIMTIAPSISNSETANVMTPILDLMNIESHALNSILFPKSRT